MPVISRNDSFRPVIFLVWYLYTLVSMLNTRVILSHPLFFLKFCRWKQTETKQVTFPQLSITSMGEPDKHQYLTELQSHVLPPNYPSFHLPHGGLPPYCALLTAPFRTFRPRSLLVWTCQFSVLVVNRSYWCGRCGMHAQSFQSGCTIDPMLYHQVLFSRISQEQNTEWDFLFRILPWPKDQTKSPAAHYLP